jgi:hypothetical protein
MKIYAPVKDANGVYASVRFVDGVGETNKPHLIEWFRNNGYTVEGEYEVEPFVKPVMEEPVVVKPIAEMMGYEEPTEKPLEDMTPGELREYCKTIGKGHLMKNIRNKEKLIEIIRG